MKMTGHSSQPMRLSELAKGRQAAETSRQHFAAKQASERRRRSAKLTYSGPRSAIPGKCGLILVAASVSVLVWVTATTAPSVASALLQAGYTGAGFDVDLLPQMLLQATGTATVATSVSSWAGSFGWLLAIFAAATDRGRGAAAVAIVLGVLAPLIVMIVFMVAVWVSVAAG